VLGKDRIPRSEAAVTRDAKYIRWPDFDVEELFDLKADPREGHNLVHDPNAAKLLAAMRAKLDKLRAEAK
jgi:arylsulfatase A-like enzyme